MSEDKEQGFFIVWSPTGVTPPKVKFYERDAAVRAATQLASRNPTARFYVLQAVEVAEVATVVVRKLGA